MAYKGYTMKLPSYDVSLDKLILFYQLENESLKKFDDDEKEALELIKKPAAAHVDTLIY